MKLREKVMAILETKYEMSNEFQETTGDNLFEIETLELVLNYIEKYKGKV